MTSRQRLAIAVLAILAALGIAAYFYWRGDSTPPIPEVPLEGADANLVDAIQQAQGEVRANPRSGEAWGKLGMVLTANGYTEPAVPCFANATRFDPDNPRWPYLHGVHLGKLGRTSEMLPFFRQAVALARSREDRGTLYFWVAILLIEEGELDEATDLVKKLTSLEPEQARGRYLLALIARARGDNATAREYFTALVDEPSARKQANHFLAEILLENRELARKHHELSERLPPDFPWPNPILQELSRYTVSQSDRMALYWQMEAEGRRDEAIDYLRRLVAASPEVEALGLLGMALYKTGDYKGCAEATAAGLALDPLQPRSLTFQGASWLELGIKKAEEPNGAAAAAELFGKAIAAEDRAIAIQKGNSLAHLVRGRAFKRLSKPDEAIRAFREAVICQPESAETHLELGLVLAESGRVKEAIEHLENAVKVARPDDLKPRAALEKWKAKG